MKIIKWGETDSIYIDIEKIISIEDTTDLNDCSSIVFLFPENKEIKLFFSTGREAFFFFKQLDDFLSSDRTFIEIYADEEEVN